MLAINCCCSLSITAVCIGCTSGSPKNCRASSGVQSTSTLIFMSAPEVRFEMPARSNAKEWQYRRERAHGQATFYRKSKRRSGRSVQFSVKPLHRERLWIGERRLTGHHLGEQAAGGRAQCQAVMLVAEVEPQPVVARRLADHRKHVRQTGPRAHPWFCLDRISQRKQRPRTRQRALDLDRRRRCVAAGEFHAGGEADTAIHRRQQKTGI